MRADPQSYPCHWREEYHHLRALGQASASERVRHKSSSSKKLMPGNSVHSHLSQYTQEARLLLFYCLELLHCYTLLLQYRN